MKRTMADRLWRSLRAQAMALALVTANLSPAFADDDLAMLQLEALLKMEVTGVSRFAQQTRQAPSAVTVLTREQIRDHAWTSLADLLDAVPDLFIATDRIYRYAGVRGFLQPSDYNTNVLLLIDGVPVNDAVYNQAFLGDAGLLDLALVERVEFIPGPGSSVYGSNAILGVINVITRRGGTMRGTTVETSLGRHGGRGLAVRHGRADDRSDLLLSASVWRSDGEDLTLPDTPETSFGRARGLEPERVRRLLLRHAWDEFTLIAAHAERSKGYASAPYGTLFGDPRTDVVDRQWLLSLSHEREWRTGVSVVARATLGRATYRGNWALEPGETLNRDDADGRWWALELQATDTRFTDHTLVYGIEHHNQYRLFQRNADRTPGAPGPVYLDDRRTARHTGAYVQDEWRSGDWRINAGLRIDHYSSFGTTANPRLGFIRDLTAHTTLKLLLGRAYRAPNVFEMQYHDGNVLMKANPSLRPERVRSAEAVLEHQAPGGWHLRASVFHNRIRDLIAQELDPADGLLVYRNRGRVRLNGLTLAVHRRWADGLRLALSSTWNDARMYPGSERLTHSPRHIAKADLTVPVGDWRATIEARRIGARKVSEGRVGAQGWVNLALVSRERAFGGASIALRLDNLLDRRLYDPASEEFEHDRLPREGRQIRLTAGWTF